MNGSVDNIAAEEERSPAGLLIVWHSRTGAAQAMAEAALAGARDDGENIARLVRAADAMPAQMLAAAGYLFVCPENLGTISGEMKEFFDRCYYPLLGRIEGRGYASAIAAGNAGQGAEAQIDRIATGWRLRRVAASLTRPLRSSRPKRCAMTICKCAGIWGGRSQRACNLAFSNPFGGICGDSA